MTRPPAPDRAPSREHCPRESRSAQSRAPNPAYPESRAPSGGPCARPDGQRAHRPARSRASRTRSSSATAASATSRSSASARAACRSRERLAGEPARDHRRRGAHRRPRHHALPRRPDADRRRPAADRPAHGDPVLDRRPPHRARRRRALHRAHDPRGARRAHRLRPAEARSSSWCSSTAATASCRSRPTTSARTCRRRGARSSRCAWRRSTGATKWPWTRSKESRHERARHAPPRQGPAGHRRPDAGGDLPDPRHRRGDEGRSARPIKKVPTLRGKTVVNLFYEPTTRTRTSFEMAEKRLSADTLNIAIAHVERRRRARR